MTGSERRGGSAGELAVLGLLTALLFGGKLALAWLPNVEPVSLLVIVYTARTDAQRAPWSGGSESSL